MARKVKPAALFTWPDWEVPGDDAYNSTDGFAEKVRTAMLATRKDATKPKVINLVMKFLRDDPRQGLWKLHEHSRFG